MSALVGVVAAVRVFSSFAAGGLGFYPGASIGSSVHDRAKVDFYNRAGVCWVEVTNDTAKLPDAVKAVSQALALSVGTSRPEKVWGYEEFP